MVCNKCGANVEHNALFCHGCGNRVRQEAAPVDRSQLKGMALWEENYLFGVLGGLLGSVAGIVVFYQWYMGFGTQFLAPIPGGILGALIAAGYWWLGKRIKTVGTWISLGLAAVSGWVANQLFWTLVAYSNNPEELRPLWEIFWDLDPYFRSGFLDEVSSVLGLISIYFGAFIGVVLVSAVYKNKNRGY